MMNIDRLHECFRYWKKDEATTDVFNASIVGDTDGVTYLRTGDMGAMVRVLHQQRIKHVQMRA